MRGSRTVIALCAVVLLASWGAESPAVAGSPQPSVREARSLAVTIGGPSAVRTGQTCTWTAQVTGGTPPYQYQWIGPIYSESQSITTGFSTPGYREFWVMVTDANDQQAEAFKYVSVASTSGC